MSRQFYNPVPFSDGKLHTNPDPFVISWCGTYYCYASDEFGVNISRSEDLTQWESLGYAISEKEFHHYWAPSVFYLNGMFYMYYSNIPIEEPDCHKEQLKLAVSDSPEGPFVWKKTFFDRFSIDSHPFMWNGELYMFYSVNDWSGAESRNAGTWILLDKMRTPEEFEGNPHPVIIPSLPQEVYMKDRFGDGRDWYTIEGACTLEHNEKVWLMYSANAYENVDYFVGTTVAEAKPDAKDMVWEKYPDPYTWHPLLKKTDLVEGTGHNTAVKAPNLADDWIVYHGRDTKTERIPGMEQRSMRVDRLLYNGRELFCQGPSVTGAKCPNEPQIRLKDVPVHIDETVFLGDAPQFYRMECWIKADQSHAGSRFGIYLDYQDEKNYLELRVSDGRGQMQIWDCRDGISVKKGCDEVGIGLDFTVPHRIWVQCNGDEFTVRLDERIPVTVICPAKENVQDQSGRIGAVSYFTEFGICSLSLTEHAQLHHESLQKLGCFYVLERAAEHKNRMEMICGDGLSFYESVRLLEKDRPEAYTEEFELEAVGAEAEVRFLRDDKVLAAGTFSGSRQEERIFSMYHIVEDGKEYVILKGRKTEETGAVMGNGIVMFSNIRIRNYSFTKN